MTYLQIVNQVLRRMREEEVSSVIQTPYSQMAGDFVNDAKSFVEDAWDWSCKRTEIPVVTSASVGSYALPGTDSALKIFSATNETTGSFLTYRPQMWFQARMLSPVEGAPGSFGNDGLSGTGEIKLRLYPIPDGVYNLTVRCSVKEPEFAEDNDETLLPTRPIIHLAIAMLARERGEAGGTSVGEYFTMAERYLADAISYDANRHPEDLIWSYI